MDKESRIVNTSDMKPSKYINNKGKEYELHWLREYPTNYELKPSFIARIAGEVQAIKELLDANLHTHTTKKRKKH